MPNPVTTTASPIRPRAPVAFPPLSVTPVELGPRYQVRPVLWGNRTRFVVRDTRTQTTIAIRATSQIADSDLIRLNMGVGNNLRPNPHSLEHDRPSLPSDVPCPGAVTQSDRQCGRCRGFFAPDPTLEPVGLQDWWLCDPCRDTLLGARRAASS
jgi:hypothetical protein